MSGGVQCGIGGLARNFNVYLKQGYEHKSRNDDNDQLHQATSGTGVF